jgi:Serine dehydratase beta chain
MLSSPPSIFSVLEVSDVKFFTRECVTPSPRQIVGPSSSHTVGPMRAGKIFINDLLVLDLLDKVGVDHDIR